jgi:curved DNA-binding protein CbpA
MGAAASTIDPTHLGIYKKLLQIQSPGTRVQMLQTLLSGPEYVVSAKRAGLYPHLLRYVSSVSQGQNPGPLPGEQQHTASIQAQQYQAIRTQVSPQQTYPQAHTQTQTQITSYSAQSLASHQANPYGKLAKPRSTEKALNFFQSCLQILGIEESATLSEELLKKAYKRIAIKAHPDKGGSEEHFEAVTRAYAYLTDIVKRVAGSAGTAAASKPVPSMDTVRSRRAEEAHTYDAPPTALNPNNLNMSVFNQVFEENRMPEPDEDGYGDWLKTEQTGSAAGAGAKKFSGKFNRDVFNQAFEEEARSNSTALMAYHDPQEIVPVAGVELGRDRPSDYTAPFNADGLHYTDLKNAYTQENTISGKVANVQVSDRTYDRMVAERKSAPSAYNEAERAYVEQQQRQREAQEQQRRIRAAEEASAAQRYAEGMKRRLLVNGSSVEGYKAISDR